MANDYVLSDNNIERIENLLKGKGRSLYPSLSNRDLLPAKEAFAKIQDLPLHSYIVFGSNAGGMTSYGFYKSTSNKIYIIEAFCNELTTYYDSYDELWIIVNNLNCLN